MIFKYNLEICILCDETLDCIEPSVTDFFWPCPSMKSEGTASFPRWKEKFHVSHSAFIDNHGVLRGELLISAGQRWQFSSPCGSIDNSGVGNGRVDNSLLPTIVKAWLHSTRLPLTPSLGEEGGGLFLPGGGANPAPMWSPWTWWEMETAHCLVGWRSQPWWFFPDTTPQKGLSGAYHSFSRVEIQAAHPAFVGGVERQGCSFSCAVV